MTTLTQSTIVLFVHGDKMHQEEIKIWEGDDVLGPT